MKHYITKLFIPGAFLFLGVAAHILAAGGNSDTGFNGSGKSVFNIESALASGSFSDIAVIGGNKFLVAGRVVISNGSYYAVTLSRFNSDGSPDISFGTGGRVITDAGITAEGTSLAVQSDGKIVVAANGGNSPDRRTVVLRYTADGVLDTTFGNNGVFLSSDMKVAKDISILADDKILIAGISDVPNLGRTQVLKLNANGSADTMFGDNGIASSTYFSGSDTDKMAVQNDGKIVVSGKNLFTAQKGLVHRFNTDGSPDPTFDGDGIREIAGPGSTFMYMDGGVALQPDGKIVLAGTANISSGNTVLLIRLNSDGSSDNTFGTQFGMIFHTLAGSSAGASDVKLQSDGKIVIAGGRNSEAIAARFDSTGAMDPSFGSGGIASLAPGTSAKAIAFQGSNMIVIGSYPITVGMSNSGIFLARLDQAGATLTYADQSIFVGKQDQARDVAIQPDGKIVAAGISAGPNGRPVASVARLLTNGSLDATFGTGGRVAFNDGLSESEAYAVDIQPDGKILIAGRHSDFSIFYGSIFVARLNADGSPDGTFGTGGKVIINLFPDLIVYDMELQPDGKIVVAGSSHRMVGDGVFNYDLLAARLNPNGTPDGGFGTNGVFTLVTGGLKSPEHEQARALSIQPDGKIILAGTHMLRLNPDSSVDSTFSPAPVPLGFTASDIKLQPDGKMLLSASTNADFTLFRYNSNASIDTSFGINGIATVDFGGADGANAIYLDTNGYILAGGSTLGGSPSRRKFALARFKPNGSPDTGFGAGGKVITDFGGDAQIFGITRQSDGKIVAAGEAKITTDRDYAIARYLPQAAPFDFDGDGKTDISIFRPSLGQWWILKSSNGGNAAFQFGDSSDRLVPGDFTGDGKTDVAIWHPTGDWFVLRSEDSSYYAFPFGISGDTPLVGDFDGDGKADSGVFRASNATWYIQKSTGGVLIQQFGVSGDKPVAADYDGDGIADIAIFRPNGTIGAEWWIQKSSNNQVIAETFGSSTDKAVPGDYTGDGKADIALWRASTGEWFILRSENSSYYAFQFGLASDVPAPGDYDGDGKFDAAVFRPSNSVWYLLRSTSGFTAVQFGVSGDTPVPGAFVR